MTRLNVSIRGTRQYAKALLRKHAGERMLVVMREDGAAASEVCERTMDVSYTGPSMGWKAS